MFFSSSLVLNQYRLLYLRTSLLANSGVSSLYRLKFSNNFLSLYSQLNLKTRSILEGNKNFKFRKLSHFALQGLKFPSKYVPLIKRYRSAFTSSLYYSYIKSRAKISPVEYLNSSSYSLRFLNLCSFIRSPRSNFSLSRNRSILHFYSSFFFIYPSCTSDEIKLSSFLNHFVYNYVTSKSLKSDSLLLNRSILNSLFFLRSKKRKFNGKTVSVSLLKSRSRRNKSKSKSKRIVLNTRRQKESNFRLRSYKRSKRLVCLTNNLISKAKVRFIRKRNVPYHIFLKWCSYRRRYYIRYKNSLIYKRHAFFKSYRWYSQLNNHNVSRLAYNDSDLRSFVLGLNRLVHRALMLRSRSYSTTFSSLKSSTGRSYASTNSLFSFYKRRKLRKMRNFLRHIRLLNKNTYNLYLKATGSNIYSTLVRNKRVLYSKWSGLFGLKKRLKSRKGAAHKISHFFHRYISRLYKKKRISRMNFIVNNGLSKFFDICLGAFGRQVAYSINYYVRFPYQKRFLLETQRHARFISSRKLRRRWSNSFLKSFSIPLVSSANGSNAIHSDLLLLIPELSCSDFSLLNSVLVRDSMERSQLLMRVIRTGRYKQRKRFHVDSSVNNDRSLLVNKLIGIFMIRYGLSTRKDFYKAVSYLNKYKSFIFNSSNANVDRDDFMSAYAILYLLKILKQNRNYSSRLVFAYKLFRRRLCRYFNKIRVRRRSIKLKKLFNKLRSNKKYNKKHSKKGHKKTYNKVAKITRTSARLINEKRKILKPKKARLSKLTSLFRQSIPVAFKLFCSSLSRSRQFRSFVKKRKVKNVSLLIVRLFSSLFKLRRKSSRRANLLVLKRLKQFKRLYAAFYYKKLRSLFSRKKNKFVFNKKSSLRKFFKIKKRHIRRYNLLNRFFSRVISRLLPSSSLLKKRKRAFSDRFICVRNTRYYRSLRKKSVKRRRSIKSRLRYKRRLWMYIPRYKKLSRKARRYLKKQSLKSRFRHGLILRLIRTRMRNFTRLFYTKGYVKLKSSPSHGGCIARKRTYDKRYIF